MATSPDNHDGGTRLQSSGLRSGTGTFRRRLNTSCWMCRKRKVRCDATETEACSSCKRARIECGPRPTRNLQDKSPQTRATPPATVNPTQHAGTDDDGQNSALDVRASTMGVSPNLSSGSLSRFFEAGLLSSDWDKFEEHGIFRNVYIGTDTANLHHLVRDHEPPGNRYLIYPFPAIYNEPAWKPTAQMLGHHYLTAESLNDLSSFPVREVRDALVDTYFRDIHPGFPIIDEADFRRRYRDADNPPPLLVFQAVLLAAACITDHPRVAASRQVTTATLFRRAKTLFDLRHEHDRVDLIQASLLLGLYTESADTVASNAYYWVGNAVRIAFGMGLHRTASLRYVPPNRRRFYRKYKKIWWSLFYKEVMLALEHGRPSLIRANDFDIGPLEDDDFLNMDDSPDRLVNPRFCCVLGELSMVALDIQNLRSPRGDVETDAIAQTSLEHRLAAVALRIPTTHDGWSCQLRLLYNLVTLVYYRTSENADPVKLCSEAGSTILTTFEAMIVKGTIHQCHLSCTTALVGAALQFAREVRSATAEGSIIKAVSAHGQLERLRAPAEALAMYFPQVEAVCRLCKSLSARAEILIKEFHAPTSPLSISQIPAEASIDWEGIMANYRMPNFGFGLEGEDWLNDFSWANMDSS